MSGLTDFNEEFKICYTGSDAIAFDDCVMGTGFWPVLERKRSINPPWLLFVYARSTISKSDQKTRTFRSCSSFFVLSAACSLEHISFSVLFYYFRIQFTSPSRSTSSF